MTLQTTTLAVAKDASQRRTAIWWQRYIDRFGVLGSIACVILAIIIIAAVFAPFLAPYDPDYPDLTYALSGPERRAPARCGRPGPRHPVPADVRRPGHARRPGPRDPAVDGDRHRPRTRRRLARAQDGRRHRVGARHPLLGARDRVRPHRGGAVGPSLFTVVGGLAVAYVPYVARVVRGAALRERNMPYVSAAWLQGHSGFSITTTQILRNVQPIVIAQAVSSLGFAVIDLAAVSFLGLGVQPPAADLGLMVKSGFDSALRGYPGEAIYSGLLIVLIVWCVTVIGDRLLSNARAM